MGGEAESLQRFREDLMLVTIGHSSQKQKELETLLGKLSQAECLIAVNSRIQVINRCKTEFHLHSGQLGLH